MNSTNTFEQTITTYDLIVQAGREATKIQKGDGSFPAGRNYSYDENSTPVRTTSQWLRTLTKAFDITGEQKFEKAANNAVDILLSNEFCPEGATYHCRDVPGKDSCNGLVGQASVIRALSYASDLLDRTDAQRRVKEVFQLHPFNKRLGLWESVEIDGTQLSFDRTLNHQLLFAGAISRLGSNSSVIRDRTKVFLDRLESSMETRTSGLIRHYVHPPLKTILREIIRTPRHRIMLRNELAYHYHTRSEEHLRKERGYQTVNLMGLVEIHQEFPSHPFWDSPTFRGALEFIHEQERDLIQGNNTKHGDALPGISIAKIYREFESVSTSRLAELVSEELSENPYEGRTPFKSLQVDEETAAALVCELVDLPEIQIET